MARTPSFDTQFGRAKASAGNVEDLSALLARSAEQAGSEDAAQPEKLKDAKKTFATECLHLVQGIIAQIDAAYCAFDRVDDVTRMQRLFGLFKRQPGQSFKAVRQRKLGIAQSVKIAVEHAAAVSGLLQGCKQNSALLVTSCEARLEASMERRGTVVSSIDEARRRDRELAASLATLERKIGGASDEAQLQRWKADRAEASGSRNEVLAQRKQLSEERALLDRQTVLLGDIIDVLNDGISVYALMLNAVAVEAERGIMLFAVTHGSLQPLLDDAQLHSGAEENDADATPASGVFDGLLALHAQGGVTMQDVDRRKTRISDALAQRFDRRQANGAETAAGKT